MCVLYLSKNNKPSVRIDNVIVASIDETTVCPCQDSNLQTFTTLPERPIKVLL
jgi:hypothetical protein